MAIGDDYGISITGDIRYTGSGDTYTVIEFHRWIGDLMDDAQAAGDDLLDITTATASERATDNIVTLLAPFNIDDDAAEYLYDGSIIQDGGATIYDGLLVLAAPGAYLEIIQNGALVTPNFWTTGLNDDASNGISHRFMLKVRSGGVDIDGRRIVGQTREFGFSYSEFRINGTSRGNNVLALSFTNDLNNGTAEATVATFTDVVNTEGYVLLDVDNNGVDEAYYSEWDRGSRTINQFYERMKWLSRRGSASTIYGLNGELFRGITHELTVGTPSGTFDAVEPVSWTGGTGQMLAIDSVTAGTKMWIQLLTGVAPTNGQTITGGTSAATVVQSGAALERPLSFPFIGQSTGSALIGAYGVGIETADLSAADLLFDLTNTPRNPPNNVTFTVQGLVIGEDRVLVGPALTGNLNAGQFTINGALTGAAVTSVVINGAIPSDTPSTGVLRVELDSGIYARLPYTSWTASTFTLTAAYDFSGDNAANGNDAWLGYIDRIAGAASETFTVVYSAERSLFVRARDGGASPIKTFEGTATLGAAGGAITIIRTPDV